MKLGDSLGRSRRGRRRRASDPDPSDLVEGETGERGDPTDGGWTAPGRERRTGGATRPEWSLQAILAFVRQNVVLTAVVLALFGWVFGYGVSTQLLFPAPPPPGDLFDVPDLTGLGVASATERLAGAGLQLGTVDSLQHPSVAAGVILGQSPLPGQVLRPSNPVRVTVSTGPQTRSVPDVRALDEARARVVLESSGFVVSVFTAEDEAPRGQVISVSPSPGDVVELPAQVRLGVSAGPPVVRMPLVLGMELAEAEASLDSLGLIVSDVEEVFRFGRDQGIVVEQEPAADTEMRRGTGVRLKVGRRGRDREQ